MQSGQIDNNQNQENIKKIRALEVDQQLALFYYIYKEMGDSITPAAPNASTVSPTIAEGLFKQAKQLSQEEQLQLQRDLINKVDNTLGREYGSLSDTTKLLFWYYLAQGMDSGTIIPMPDGYELTSDAQQLMSDIKKLDFNVQMSLFREYVAPMGAQPKQGAGI